MSGAIRGGDGAVSSTGLCSRCFISYRNDLGTCPNCGPTQIAEAVQTIAALRAENARLTSEVERLEAKFQQNFGCHHSWVRDHAEHRRLLSEVERLRVVAEAARACYDSEDEWSLCITSPPCGACKPCALKAALDAAGGEILK